MSLNSRLSSLVLSIGIDVGIFINSFGNKNNLLTTNKDNLVNSINELKISINNINLSSIINDFLISNSTIYSSDKIQNLVTSKIDEVIDNSPETLNTLNELSLSINNDNNLASNLNNSLSFRVNVDIDQGFNETQKQQGRDNLGILSLQDLNAIEVNIGNYDNNLLASYNESINPTALMLTNNFNITHSASFNIDEELIISFILENLLIGFNHSLELRARLNNTGSYSLIYSENINPVTLSTTGNILLNSSNNFLGLNSIFSNSSNDIINFQLTLVPPNGINYTDNIKIFNIEKIYNLNYEINEVNSEWVAEYL